MVIIVFYFHIGMEFTLSTIISRKKNENTSFDVYYNFFMTKMVQLLCCNFFVREICLREKNNNSETLAKHVM